MAKFIEIDGWTYDGYKKHPVHYLVNINNIVSTIEYSDDEWIEEDGFICSNYNEGILYELKSGKTFYVSKEEHQRILNQLETL